MLPLYTIAIFLSAALLFIVQPLFARMALPMLGGSPAVWNTALVFYQAVLLAGYAYAHFSTRWLGPRRQAMLHVLLLPLPLLLFPIGIPQGWAPPTQTSPLLWLLAALLVGVGLPFFVVSATSPLLQRWFAASGHRFAADPYFLYAASNAGSMLALLSYPFLLEPYLPVRLQSEWWGWGYGALVCLLALCVVALLRRPVVASEAQQQVAGVADEQIGWPRRVRWVLLALVPSSLMVSVTTYLSTDIAAIPLLWIVPLALYLLTFIIVFASKPLIPHWLATRALPIVLLPLVIVLAARASQPINLLIPLHLLVFFVITLVCHGELARDRPAAGRLTEFYLLQSLGGVLGGAFNALLAPLLFTSVVEYPLMLVLACLLAPLATVSRRPTQATASDSLQRADQLRLAHWRPLGDVQPAPRTLDLVLPLALGVATAACVLVVEGLSLFRGSAMLAIMFGVPTLLCFTFSRRPLRLALGVGAVLLAATLYRGPQGNQLYAERSFFGIHRVTTNDERSVQMLFHGSTLHGVQNVVPPDQQLQLTYYYPTGPIGQVFSTLIAENAQRSVAVVGLGTGTLACYRVPGQQWTYYEIDPAVERIARDPRFFTYLSDCDPQAEIVLGDARLSLAQTTNSYDLIILDAYSSDSIPVHLLTREALQLYLQRLAPGGVLAFHISNQHLNLEPVLADLSNDAGLVALINNDLVISQEDGERGKASSQWMLLARKSTDMGPLAADSRWQPARSRPGSRLWTDDYSSLLSVLTW